MNNIKNICFFGGGSWGQALAITLARAGLPSSILVSDKKMSKWKKDIDELPSHKLSCDKSLLIIDDECDNASIDISKRKIPLEQMEPEEREQFEQTDPSKTNQLIRGFEFNDI